MRTESINAIHTNFFRLAIKYQVKKPLGKIFVEKIYEKQAFDTDSIFKSKMTRRRAADSMNNTARGSRQSKF